MAFIEAKNPEEALKVAAQVAAGAARAARMPAHARAKVLNALAEGVRAAREEWAKVLAEEVAKPLKDGRREADRAVFTLSYAAGEALRWTGQWVPLDAEPAGENRSALIKRVPRGPALFISPFNFPLNLSIHKVAPAIAAGVPFLLKPPPQAPKAGRMLAEALSAAGWPDECGAVVSCPNDAAEALVKDERFATLSFTGSAGVGWKLKTAAGRKHVVLELGGAACVAVCADADLALAAARCAAGGFVFSGQTCISVQRIVVEASAYEEFKQLLLANVAELKVGAPESDADVGPLIDEKAAMRIEEWVKEAVAGGGKLLCGGTRSGRTCAPTVVEDAPAGCRLVVDEVFGPVVTLEKAATAEGVLAKAGTGVWGLQTGIFTKDIDAVLSAWNSLQVGGLCVNEVPTYRSDILPYGGSRMSGIGREGVRWAMEELTEPRALILTHHP
ncbi:MAG: aldehyde dehydrogenase family protein [Elusimicrobia bacterium]|nr:aldehyde dehydrogenase family protein [Elusimicrobiota bacterium]